MFFTCGSARKGFLLWSEIFIIMRKHAVYIKCVWWYVNPYTLQTLKIFFNNFSLYKKAADATSSRWGGDTKDGSIWVWLIEINVAVTLEDLGVFARKLTRPCLLSLEWAKQTKVPILGELSDGATASIGRGLVMWLMPGEKVPHLLLWSSPRVLWCPFPGGLRAPPAPGLPPPRLQGPLSPALSSATVRGPAGENAPADLLVFCVLHRLKVYSFSHLSCEGTSA